MTRRVFRLACLAIVAALAAAGSAPVSAEPVARPAVRALSPAELDTALASGKWLIVEFGGEHCIPCMRMQPVLQDLKVALTGRAEVNNFWILDHPDTARRFGIMVMPTQVVFDPTGAEVYRHMGYFPPEELHRVLKEKGVL